MVKDMAVPSHEGLAVAVARGVDRVGMEWAAGRKWLASRWSRWDETMELRDLPKAADLVMGVDPLIAVRWRGSW